jgi:hypothetical protein
LLGDFILKGVLEFRKFMLLYVYLEIAEKELMIIRSFRNLEEKLYR